MTPIPYGRQHITEEDIAMVVQTLKADYLTTGPKVDEFEEKFATYIGSNYAVAVANGTAALHLCALALEVNDETHVITSPITFSASANCIKYCGGNIHFTDIDPGTITLDIQAVKNLIESKPSGFFSGIIPVDLAGYPVNMESFKELAEKHNLWIIEDACHAPGGWFTDSKRIKQNCGNGNFVDLAIFHFIQLSPFLSGEILHQ